MPNITITTTANTIKAEFNDTSAYAGAIKGCWAKSTVTSIKLGEDNAYVTISISGEERWNVSYTNGSEKLVVDSVDGFAPVNNSDLYDKLVALIA